MAMSTLTVPLPWVGQYETGAFNLTPAMLATMPAFVMDPTLFVAKVRTDNGSGSGLTRRNDPDVRAAVTDVLEAALQGAGMSVSASQDYAARIVNTGPDSYNRAAGLAARIVVLAQVDAAGGNATIGPATATFAASANAGSTVFTITGLATGETLTSISPNDGRVRLSSTGGVVGLSASTAGIVEYTVKTSFNREHTVSVTVTGSGGALAISGSPAVATVGSAYSFTPTVTGGSGTKSFSLSGTLPAGLSFSTSTGAITGTPTTAGTTSGLAITVTDTSGSATLSGLSIVVSAGGAAQPYTLATKFVAGSVGMRWPNKQGTLNNSAFTKTCETLSFVGPPWVVPAGASGVVGFSDRFRLEGDQTGTNETVFANDHTIEAVSISYTDAGGTARVATASTISGGGVCGPGSTTLGGILATMTFPADMPASAPIVMRVARSVAAGGNLPAYYRVKSGAGESFRGHTTTSFATVVNAGQDASANTGSASAGITGAGGSSPGPSFICFKGSDGRPATINLGHSLLEGKGTDDLNTPADRSKGMLSVGLASTTNGYVIPHIDVSVAGADFQRRDPGNANYNANILSGLFALVAQVTSLNGGTPPVSHGISEDYNNSEQPTLTAQIALVKAASINFLKGKISGIPIIRTSSEIAVSASTDGFATLAGQTAKSPTDRAGFNTKLFADLLDGTCAFALDVMTPLSATGSATSSSADQGKFTVQNFRPTVTRAYTSGGASIYLSAAPRVGTALNKQESGGAYQVKVVTAVASQPEGDFLVTVANGNGSSTWGDAAVGVVLQEQLSADAAPATGGLHYSQVANGLIAAGTGTYSFQALKAQLKSAVSGAWT